MIFGRQYFRKKTMCNCWNTVSPPRLIIDATLPCKVDTLYSYKIPQHNKQKVHKIVLLVCSCWSYQQQ